MSEGKTTSIRLRIFFGLLALGAIVWTVVKTEMRVADLRSRGFTEVAIDSARDHAYLPLAGGLIGAIAAIVLVKIVKKLLGKR